MTNPEQSPESIITRIRSIIGVSDNADVVRELQDYIVGLASGVAPRDAPPDMLDFTLLGTEQGIPALVFTRVGMEMPPVMLAYIVIDDQKRVLVLQRPLDSGAPPIPWGEGLAWQPLEMASDGYLVPVGWMRLYNARSGHQSPQVEMIRHVRMQGALQREAERLQRACDEALPREVIPCPRCEVEHVDGTNGAEFARRPHHTHLCAACGYSWDSGRWSFGVASEMA